MIEALILPLTVALWAGAALAVAYAVTSIWSAIAATVRLVQAARRSDNWDKAARDLVAALDALLRLP